MTTIDSAAAWRVLKPITLAVFAAFASLGLGGCETSSNLFASLAPNTATDAAGNSAQPAATAIKRVAIAPVIGAPDSIATKLNSRLSAALTQKSVVVASGPNAQADYTLRGYVVSAREKTQTKVSYIWDVTDPTGKRVNRITGEEVAAAGASRDPWASVNDGVVQRIVDKTTQSLVTWLPTQKKAAPPAVAGNTAAPTTGSTGRNSLQPVQKVNHSTKITGTNNGAIQAIVPSVTGAPGDGSVSLTSAIQKELSRGGIALASTPTANTYRVEGQVNVGAAAGGKQPIRIDWHVRDPNGRKLGSVTQKNEIPAGTLNGAWGKTADAAAAAAAQGIVKLLKPEKTASN